MNLVSIRRASFVFPRGNEIKTQSVELKNGPKEFPYMATPLGFRLPLLRHQMIDMDTMNSIEEDKELFITIDDEIYRCTPHVGILGQPVGFGKTAMICAYLQMYPLYEIPGITKYISMSKSHLDSNDYFFNVEKKFILHSTNIIVCNHSLINMPWEHHLKLAQLSYMIIAPRHVSALFEFRNSKDPTRRLLDSVDVILCPNTVYNKLAFQANQERVCFQRCIIDEADAVNISGMKHMPCAFLWMVTATYDNIENNKGRLNHSNSDAHFLRLIGRRISKMNLSKQITVCTEPEIAEQVRETFPNIIKHIVICKSSRIIQAAVKSGIFSTDAIEKIRAGNIEGAIKSIGGDSSGNILHNTLEKFRNKIISAEMKIQEWMKKSEEENKRTKIVHYQQKKEKAEQELQNMSDRFSDIFESSDCPICYDSVTNGKPVMLTCCHHIFCWNCIQTWIEKSTKSRCPFCRTEITNAIIAYLPSELIREKKFSIDNVSTKKGSSKEEEEKYKSKSENVIDIVYSSHKKERILLFSSDNTTYDIISNALKEKGITYSELKGNTSQRSKILHEFQDGKIQLLFLNSKHNGAGINLQFVKKVILYHKLKPRDREQVLGRTFRLGSTKQPIDVFELVEEDEIIE